MNRGTNAMFPYFGVEITSAYGDYDMHFFKTYEEADRLVQYVNSQIDEPYHARYLGEGIQVTIHVKE
jgi:hypothetical protein